MTDNYKPYGLIEITGEHDTGKTLAALFANYEHGYSLKDMVYFHDDVKEPGYNPGDFGLYVDLVNECRGMKLFERRKYILGRIKKITKGQFKAIIFDTWYNFGESLQNYVINNRGQFRDKKEFIMPHEPKAVGAQSWRDAHNYEASIAGHIKSLCNVFVVTSHLKDHYQASAKTGKKVDQLGKSWGRICNMRLWLRHNPDGAVPITLVLKRPHKPGIKDSKPTSTSILPRRFRPQLDHNSIWETINYYYQNPAGNREVLEDEIPTPFELSILDGILTDDQKEMWKAELVAQREQEQQEQAFFNSQMDAVKEEAISLHSNHKPNPLPAPMVFNQLIDKYPNLTLEQVQGWL